MSEAGTVWLVGMMGSGKSTVGRALAERLGRPFVDTDAEIERAAGRSVSEIFAAEGEAGFRARERAELERWLGKAVVAALGGGAIAQPGVPERLGAAGTVVYLRARPETLALRVGDGSARPLLEAAEGGLAARLADLLAERREAYESARLAVDTDDLSAAEVAEVVAAALAAEAPA